jgi:hypothetical protein
VLVAVALFLLFAGESAARITREVRLTIVRQHAELAFYAADAGFNRVRARLTTRQATPADILALNGRTETLYTTDENGDPVAAGTYTLTVTQPNPNDSKTFHVVSTGTYGTGRYAAKRVVAGTLFRRTQRPSRQNDWVVDTTYDP